jgi:hypothetical protein
VFSAYLLQSLPLQLLIEKQMLGRLNFHGELVEDLHLLDGS